VGHVTDVSHLYISVGKMKKFWSPKESSIFLCDIRKRY